MKKVEKADDYLVYEDLLVTFVEEFMSTTTDVQEWLAEHARRVTTDKRESFLDIYQRLAARLNAWRVSQNVMCICSEFAFMIAYLPDNWNAKVRSGGTQSLKRIVANSVKGPSSDARIRLAARATALALCDVLIQENRPVPKCAELRRLIGLKMFGKYGLKPDKLFLDGVLDLSQLRDEICQRASKFLLVHGNDGVKKKDMTGYSAKLNQLRKRFDVKGLDEVLN
jgi:hypothetical protein